MKLKSHKRKQLKIIARSCGIKVSFFQKKETIRKNIIDVITRGGKIYGK